MSQKPLLPQHSRYDFVPLPDRKDYSWPGGKRLAFVITTNVEWFAFGHEHGHLTPIQSRAGGSWETSGKTGDGRGVAILRVRQG